MFSSKTPYLVGLEDAAAEVAAVDALLPPRRLLVPAMTTTKGTVYRAKIYSNIYTINYGYSLENKQVSEFENAMMVSKQNTSSVSPLLGGTVFLLLFFTFS